MALWSVALPAGDWIEQQLNAGLVSKTGIFNIDIHRASGCIVLVGLWPVRSLFLRHRIVDCVLLAIALLMRRSEP